MAEHFDDLKEQAHYGISLRNLASLTLQGQVIDHNKDKMEENAKNIRLNAERLASFDWKKLKEISLKVEEAKEKNE